MQTHTTFDLILATYLSFENLTINFIKSKKDGKPVLAAKITNDDPNKDLNQLVRHYETKIQPYIRCHRRGKIAVKAGQQQFEVSLLRTIFDAWSEKV